MSKASFILGFILLPKETAKIILKAIVIQKIIVLYKFDKKNNFFGLNVIFF